jgi:GNAT superfamily N-acetyltransferase
VPTPNLCNNKSENDAAITFIASVFDAPVKSFSWASQLGQPDDAFWISKLNDEIATAIVVRPVQMTSHAWGIAIGMVATSPAHRRKGLASGLIDHTVSYYHNLGAEFAVLWAREALLPVYKACGFTDIVGEFDYGLEPQMLPENLAGGLLFQDFYSANHVALEKFRMAWEAACSLSKGPSTITRKLNNGQWQGISGARGNKFGILTKGPEQDPEFYAVIAYGGDLILIIEFVGSSKCFDETLCWVKQNLGEQPIQYSVTSPSLDIVPSGSHIIKKQVNFFTMRRYFDTQPQMTPHLTWLDRL